ncbi:MAG: GntR family transcriptional regulator [Rhodobacteraceae bacterium]|jgi:DNA-binding GntR family transcriptional regulator|nr:GntR family transcriptional regulator [Paracoccaceae bacterium]
MAADTRHGEQGLSAQARAYRYLFEEIRCGRLAGGTHVVAEGVAQALGVSRMPVREAIRQLASEGYLTLRSNRGAVVTALGPEEITELFEMRAVLEGHAAGLVASRIDAEGLEEVALSLQRLDRARRDIDWFVRAHDQFHDALLRYCPRPRIVAEIVRIRTATEPYLRLTLRMSPTALAFTLAEHQEVLDALRTGSGETAEACMRRHILATDIVSILARGRAAASPG